MNLETKDQHSMNFIIFEGLCRAYTNILSLSLCSRKVLLIIVSHLVLVHTTMPFYVLAEANARDASEDASRYATTAATATNVTRCRVKDLLLTTYC